MIFSVVIPTRARAEKLARTLDALSRQTDQEFEVIVVSDGPDPQTERLAGDCSFDYPIQWVFLPDRRGAATARNEGALAARGEYLAFLDDDTDPTSDWLGIHRKRQLCALRRLVVVGRVIDVYSREPTSERERLLRRGRAKSLREFERTHALIGPRSVHSHVYKWRTFGLNCSIRRAEFIAATGYDPELSECDEDMELGSRLYDSGLHFVFDSGAVVYHRDSKDLLKYVVGCWRVAGRIDLYRATRKHQRNPQTQGITLIAGHPPKRWKVELAWKHPNVVRRAESALAAATETTGWPALFHLWCAAAYSVEYWQGIKSEVIDPRPLRRLIGSPIKVFTFHGIFRPEGKKERKYHVSSSRFQRLLQRITNLYRVGTPEEAFCEHFENPAVLTFDDGYEGVYHVALPELIRLGSTALVFLVANHVGGTNVWDRASGARNLKLLSSSQIREMQRYGVRFGSHSLSHAFLTRLTDRELRREVSDSKARLEDLLGTAVTSFAYPYGDVDARVRAAVAEAGYRFGFTANLGANLWDDLLALKRIELSERDRGLDLWLKIRMGRSFLPGDMVASLRRAPKRIRRLFGDD